MTELLMAGQSVYGSLKNLRVWNKDNAGMGSLYRSQREQVFVYKQGNAAHRNNVQLGVHGRNRTNVWSYPGVNSFARKGAEGNLRALHPTVKPIQMVADASSTAQPVGTSSWTDFWAAARHSSQLIGLAVSVTGSRSIPCTSTRSSVVGSGVARHVPSDMTFDERLAQSEPTS